MEFLEVWNGHFKNSFSFRWGHSLSSWSTWLTDVLLSSAWAHFRGNQYNYSITSSMVLFSYAIRRTPKCSRTPSSLDHTGSSWSWSGISCWLAWGWVSHTCAEEGFSHRRETVGEEESERSVEMSSTALQLYSACLLQILVVAEDLTISHLNSPQKTDQWINY